MQGERELEGRKDFCSYWRGFLLGIGCAIGILAFITGVGIITIVYPLIGLLALALHGTPLELISAIGLSIDVMILLSIGYGHLPKQGDKPPGLIKMKYLSWKNKFCPMVEFK